MDRLCNHCGAGRGFIIHREGGRSMAYCMSCWTLRMDVRLGKWWFNEKLDGINALWDVKRGYISRLVMRVS